MEGETFDPRAISKKTNQIGRDNLAAEIRETRQLRDAVNNNEALLTDRQETVLVRIKNLLGISDKKSQALQTTINEQKDKLHGMPDPKKSIEKFKNEALETPLSNQEKRELLKPEALAQLTTQEYTALWKRLNPFFLTHITRQGFRDHNAMIYHSGGLREFHNGLVNVVSDEKMLRPPLALDGLKTRDELTVKMYLSNWALQADTEEEALKRFDNQLHWSLGSAPTFPDKTAVHLATQLVANDYYGGETGNEVFFVFPSDVLASQYNFSFNGWEKDFTKPQSETKWNDVFVWPNSTENSGIMVDSGLVFLPKSTKVDRNTGSKYASEIKTVDGVTKIVMVENTDLKTKFIEWSKRLTDDSELVQYARKYYDERHYDTQRSMSRTFDRMCKQEMLNLGFDEDSANAILRELTQTVMFWNKDIPDGKYEQIIDESSARFKKSDDTITAMDYWEEYFSKHPDLKPKHIVYYDGDPTDAIYKFQKENGIGSADTSKTDGDLLGFDDHFVPDMGKDPRASVGHDDLVALGNKIIKEHYQYKT